MGSTFGFRTEPVAIIALVNTALAVAVEFGVDITGGQQTAIIALANAVCALFLRTQVTSEATLRAAGTSTARKVSVFRNSSPAPRLAETPHKRVDPDRR